MMHEKVNPLASIIQEYAVKLFGGDVVSISLDEGGATDITIRPNCVSQDYSPKEIVVSIDTLGYTFMFIDDFRWEFDDDMARAQVVIKEYLQAVKEGTLRRRGLRFVSERLEIGEQRNKDG